MRRFIISQDSLDYMAESDVSIYLEYKGFQMDWPVRRWDRADTWETVFEQPTLRDLIPSNWCTIFVS